MIRESLQYSRHNNCTFDHLTIFKYTEKNTHKLFRRFFILFPLSQKNCRGHT